MISIQKDDDISVLPLNVRAIHSLKKNGYKTVQQFLDCPEEVFWNMRGVGVGTVQVILACRSMIRNQNGKMYLESTKNEDQSQTFGDEIEILLDSNGKLVSDLPLESLKLDNRTQNCLQRAGIHMVSQLLQKTQEELARIHNMGPQSLEETCKSLEKIKIVTDSADADDISSLYTFDSLADDLARFYQGTRTSWLWEIIRVHNNYPSIQGENFICLLYSENKTREAAEQKILSILDHSRQPLHYCKLQAQMPSHLENNTVLDEILIEMEWCGQIHAESDGEGKCWMWRCYPNLEDCLPILTEHVAPEGQTQTRARQQKVLSMRLSGCTLEEVGKQIGVTRERVRQIEKKALRNIRQVQPRLAEDVYLSLYKDYDLTKEAFQEIFQIPDKTLCSLQILYEKAETDRKPALELLEDERLDLQVRRRANTVLHRDCLQLDGHWIRRNRTALAEYYVAHYCKEEAVSYAEFIENFNAFVKTLPMDDSEMHQIFARADDNGLSNQLRESSQVLWARGKRFRYYNMDAQDFTELTEAIDLDSYDDVKISALKFFRDEPELMRRYDIRNEYELHNLLKKLWKGKGGRVTFSRMPTIRIGNGSYENQMVQMLQQEGPMTTEAACTRFEELYGVKAETCLGAYLMQPDKIFCTDGIHQVDCPPMPEMQLCTMKPLLDQDFYTIQEVQELYHEQFPEMADTELSPYHMKQLGFTAYTGYNGYLIRDTYASAREYFSQLLDRDVLDLKRENPILNSIATFNNLQHELRRNFDIVEFAPGQFVNIRSLETCGITKADLLAYTEEVAKAILPGSYFTVKSLRQSGFVSEKLDSTGFEEWFYSSILMENTEMFSCQRIGGTRIFLRGEAEATLGDMLTRLIEQTPDRYMEIHDLNELLTTQYGIVLSQHKLAEIVRGTTMFYEGTTMKTVYLDYDVYIEEI